MSFTKVKNNNLYDPDLITLAEKGIGTGADQIVKLNSSGELPTISGVNLTNLPSVGPIGPTGAIGPIGATGPTGATGADGSGSGDLLSTNNLSDLSNVTTSRSNLGLVIGTDVQAFDATIVVDADIGTTVQAYDSTIVVDADIGTTVQAYDADLTTLATNGIGTSANQIVKLDGTAKLPAVDGSQLTNLPAGKIDITASGALSNGDLVILNSDGTVSVVVGSGTPGNIPSGSVFTVNSTKVEYLNVAFDQNNSNKFVIAYKDSSNSSYGTAIVGTVSGNSISFGTKVVFSSNTIQFINISFNPSVGGKLIISYQNNNNSSYGTAIIGTVSGTTITFGSEYIFHSAETNYTSVSWDPNNANKFVLGYKKYWSGNPGVARIGTVSGTTITFGSEYNINSQGTDHLCITYDVSTSNKFIATYLDRGNSYYGNVVIGSVSGNVITFGSIVVYNSGSTIYPISASDFANEDSFIIGFRDDTGTPSQVPSAVAGTISGTTITLGTTTRIFSGTGSYASIALYNGEFIMAIQHATNNDYPAASEGSVSGTTITVRSENVLESVKCSILAVDIQQSNGKCIFTYTYNDTAGGGDCRAVLGNFNTQSTNLTATNFLGTSEGAFADTATATVTPRGGITTTQSGLTIGSKYYVQTDGTLSTTPASPSVVAGRAISATTLLIAGET